MYTECSLDNASMYLGMRASAHLSNNRMIIDFVGASLVSSYVTVKNALNVFIQCFW